MAHVLEAHIIVCTCQFKVIKGGRFKCLRLTGLRLFLFGRFNDKPAVANLPQGYIDLFTQSGLFNWNLDAIRAAPVNSDVRLLLCEGRT
jgi:hypothetical protein